MIALISGEMLKIRTTRSFWWTLILGLGLVLLFTIVPLAQGVSTESDIRDILSNVGIIGLLMIILGVVGTAGEYRHGTITSSLLAVPDRVRYLTSKAMAYFAYGGLATLVGMVIVLAITVPWLDGDGTSLSDLGIDGGALVSIIFGALAYSAIGAVFGVAIGGLLRNQVAGIVGVLLILLFIDPLLGALIDSYAKYSLSGISDSLDAIEGSSDGYDPLSRGVAAALFLAYSTALIGACVAADSRRDVSS